MSVIGSIQADIILFLFIYLLMRLLRVRWSSSVESLSSLTKKEGFRSAASFVRNGSGISRAVAFCDWSASRDHEDSCIMLTRRRLVSVSDEYLNLQSPGQQRFGMSFVLAGWSQARHVDLTDQGAKCSGLVLISSF